MFQDIVNNLIIFIDYNDTLSNKKIDYEWKIIYIIQIIYPIMMNITDI